MSTDAALAVLDRFTAAFNRQDGAAMDATLHFPHVFLGASTVVWSRPGSLPADFFPQLVGTGWAFSRYTKKQVVQASAERVHVLVEYDRCRSNGSVLLSQTALWIVGCVDGRWGIQVRALS